jgi:RNA polymerase sigma factor (sigma-70 family)
VNLDDEVLPVRLNREPSVGSAVADDVGGSFETFYVESWVWAVRVATLITQSSGAGQEVAQDSLLAVYRRWGQIEQPKAYLRRAIMNRCQNWQRGQRTRREKLPLLAEPSAVELGASDLADVIAGLPTRQRSVLVLRYYCGFSETEIADALGCRPGTVKSLSFRALRRLRKEIPR